MKKSILKLALASFAITSILFSCSDLESAARRREPAAPAKQPANTWSCPTCTYLNPEAATACTICKTSRPTAPVTETSTSWTCESCTFNNHQDAANCSMCVTPRVKTPTKQATACTMCETSTSWTCASCTFNNHQDAANCSMCVTPRAKTKAQQAASPAKPRPMASQWACPTCKTPNEQGDIFCLECGSINPAAIPVDIYPVDPIQAETTKEDVNCSYSPKQTTAYATAPQINKDNTCYHCKKKFYAPCPITNVCSECSQKPAAKPAAPQRNIGDGIHTCINCGTSLSSNCIYVGNEDGKCPRCCQ
jgi:membrane protease subunit (stomatin/prohibitin family)